MRQKQVRHKAAIAMLSALCLCLFGQAQSLKVLTYNIHHANPPTAGDAIDLPAIAAVIKASGAGLVALQEVDVHTERSGKTSHQAKALGELTGMHHYFVKAIDHQGGDYGIAILSAYPFIDTASYALPMAAGVGGEQRMLAVVTVAPQEGKPIAFASTHLDLKEESKILQAQAIVDLARQSGIPMLLGGDFNAKPDSETIGILDGYFKRSSIPNGFTIPVTDPNREIDYIMFAPQNRFEVTRHEVIDERYASDHLPVYVEVEYR